MQKNDAGQYAKDLKNEKKEVFREKER